MAFEGVFEGVSLEDPSTLFELTAKLGEGSYGSVFKAVDLRDSGVVAIKMIQIEPGENFLELQKEINILKECASEFVVGYRGTFQLEDKLWIVMEYCDAGSVMDLMSICEKTLTEAQIAVIMKQALQGLHYLHSARKIHRDIKSGNLLLTHKGECKLADFGVSAELTNTVAKRKTMIGTPYWMAPEVLQANNYDGKADIWSLAITAFELAVGEPPNSEIHPMRAIFLIPSQPPPTLPNPENWSAQFHEFMRICLVKDPSQRPSAQQLLATCDFIVNSPPLSLIADLVRESMEQIERFRIAESEEKEEGEEDEGDYGTLNSQVSEVANSTLSRGSSTESLNSGTMVNNQATLRPGAVIPKSSSFRGSESGTMHPSMVPKPKPDMGTMVTHAPMDSGTMVSHSSMDMRTMVSTPGPTARPQYATIKAGSESGLGTLVIKTEATPSTNNSPPASPITTFKPVPPSTPPPRLAQNRNTPTPPPTPPPNKRQNLPVPPPGPPPRRNNGSLRAQEPKSPPLVHMGTARTMQSLQPFRLVDMQTREDEMQMLLDSITIISQQPPTPEREETLEELGKKLAALQIRPTNKIMGLPPPPPTVSRQLTRSAGLIAKEKKEAAKAEEARMKAALAQPTGRGWQAKKQGMPSKGSEAGKMDVQRSEVKDQDAPFSSRPATLTRTLEMRHGGIHVTKETSLLDLRAEMGLLQLWYAREKERLKAEHDERVRLIQEELKRKETKK